MKYFVFLALIVSCLWGYGKVECPKRSGESELSFSQVMYHFGRAVRVAQDVARPRSSVRIWLVRRKAFIRAGFGHLTDRQGTSIYSFTSSF